MTTSQNGKDLLREWEGLRREVYLDSGGAPTIGIGHLLTKDERRSGKIVIGNVEGDYREGLTEQQCLDLLAQDLQEAEQCVNRRVRVYLTQNQFDCLVAFAFNVGCQAFAGSTLLRVLNAGRYDEVPAQLKRWVFDNGSVVPGLVNRRKKEIDLWTKEAANEEQTRKLVGAGSD